MSREDCAKETGQSILKAHQTFHDRIHLLKKHLANSKHPIYRLIKSFKKKFYKENVNYLRKYSEVDPVKDGSDEQAQSYEDQDSLKSPEASNSTKN